MRTMTTLPWGRPLTEADLSAHPFGDADVELVGGSLVVTRTGGFTRTDLETSPDDGHRYELLDGELLVTPSPTGRHQRIAGRLFSALVAACPAELEVFFAPLDVPVSAATTLEPDLLVIRRGDLHGPRQLPGLPLLAVEILSPSTRALDLGRKRSAYERAGVPSYWVVDPDVPRLIAWELVDGAFVEVADVARDASWAAELPFPVTVSPAPLLA